jgi:hypothetical protein
VGQTTTLVETNLKMPIAELNAGQPLSKALYRGSPARDFAQFLDE